MKLEVKQETCIGCGACVSTCSEVYDFNDDGLAHVIETPVKDENITKATEAKDACPVGAIVEVDE